MSAIELNNVTKSFGHVHAVADVSAVALPGQVTALTKVFETNPIPSPDGARIAFTSDRNNRKLSTDRLGPGSRSTRWGPTAPTSAG